MCRLLRASLLVLTLFTLRALAVPSGVGRQNASPIQLDAASSVERLRRQGNECPAPAELLAVNKLLTGLRYGRDILHSCKTPTLYPDVAAAPQESDVFPELVSTIDQVLRLYDFYDTYLTNNCTETTASMGEEEASSECVEIRALTAVIGTLTNQTCDWIRSLGISYSGSDEEFVCTRSQLKKLHALTSALMLFREIYRETRAVVQTFVTTCNDSGNSVPTANWLQSTGLNTTLHTILAGTDYEAPHLDHVLNATKHPNC